MPGPTPSRAVANERLTKRQEVASGAVEPEALVATHWFDSGEDGEPYSATVRFTGRRIGNRGRPHAGDTFAQDETVEGIIPGSGPVSITSWIYGLHPGDWTVSAELVRISSGAGGRSSTAPSRPIRARPIPPAAWSWRRWALATGPSTPTKTRWALLAPLAKTPAVIPGSVPFMVAVGAMVALVSQAVLLSSRGISVTAGLVVSLLAIVAGFVGAKLWYAVLHPGQSILKTGWAVDGFLIVAPVVAGAALLALNIPIGLFLDATAPGLFFAAGIGRLGCFFTGCCAGRCTRSRWGVWSSDRRVGARRVPTQLLESATGLLIGVATLPLVLGSAGIPPGATFVAAFIGYALVRQSILRLRAEQRRAPITLPATAVAVLVVALVLIGMSLLQAA